MASNTGGVKPMTITGRMVRERERLLGMSPEERAWRAQWLKDQQLSHHEPRHVPEYWKERLNPIRRFYRAPLDLVQKGLTPVLVCLNGDAIRAIRLCNGMVFFSQGVEWAHAIRFWTGKMALIGFSIYAGAYYFKYNQNVCIFLAIFRS